MSDPATPPVPPAFTAPAGYAPPPGVRPSTGFGQPPAPARTRAVGVAAVVLAIVATVGAAIIGGIAGFQIRLGADLQPVFESGALAGLSPVRGWVLTGELAFWIGTALGLAALVLGVVALATRRGVGFGIGAVITAALGPVVFFAVLTVALAVV